MRAETAALRVATYNIHRAVGTDRQRNPARIAGVLGELRADVVGLQEVDWHDEPGRRHAQFEYLARLPGYAAVAGPNLRDHRGHYGNLLLTHLPIRAVRLHDLSLDGREPRGAVDVDLALGDGSLRVIVTHLGLRVRERWRQAWALRRLLQQTPDRPTVLLGDLNDWLPGSPTVRPLLALCASRRHPRTFPSRRPLLALDRILTRALPMPKPPVAHRSATACVASDHLPVVADLHLPD